MSRLNEKFSIILGKLAEFYNQRGDVNRRKSYQTAQEIVAYYPTDIKHAADLKNTPKIGPSTLEKLAEFERTGQIQLLVDAENSPYGILTKIYGIGPENAKKLIADGITCVSDLRMVASSKLNAKQMIGLQYYEQLLERIPREEIDLYKSAFTDVLKLSQKNAKLADTAATHTFEIVGSYRRGATDSGDIDVILSSRTSKFFEYFVGILKNNNLIIESLTEGKTKSYVIMRITPSATARRVDFLYAPPIEYPFSILYFTGSAEFNVAMRGYLRQKQLTLNEHTLCHILPTGKKGDPIAAEFTSERDIFDYIGLEWKEPHERLGRQSIVIAGQHSTPKIAANNDDDGCTFVELGSDSDDDNSDVEIEVETVAGSSDVLINIDNFRKKGINYLDTLADRDIYNLMTQVEYAYRESSEPLMTDDEYDIFSDWFTRTGHVMDAVNNAILSKKVKKLPLLVPMPSLAKLKLEELNRIVTWFNKYPGKTALSVKLDGVSVEYASLGIGSSATEQQTFKMKYTNQQWKQNETQKCDSHNVGGMTGQDIMHLFTPGCAKIWRDGAPPQSLPPCIIRGEFIMPRANFVHFPKYVAVRSLMGALIHTLPQDVHKNTKPLSMSQFVAYEVCEPTGMTRMQQYKWLHAHGFITVPVILPQIDTNAETKDEIVEKLKTNYVEMREHGTYDIDGLVAVHSEKAYPLPVDGSLQPHAFAFKMSLDEQCCETIARDVKWPIQKDSKSFPTVYYDPVIIGGVCCTRATGNSAKFIIDYGIAPGTILMLRRSGDVIPKIYDTKNRQPPQMPTFKYKFIGAHIYADLSDPVESKSQNDEMHAICVAKFFKDIGVVGLGKGNVDRIMKAGYKTIDEIICMDEHDYVDNVDGFEETMANKIINSIDECLEKVTLPVLMTASNAFGSGFNVKKITTILSQFPDVLTCDLSQHEKIAKLVRIDGIQTKTAEKFVNGIDKFMDFVEEIGFEHKLSEVSPTPPQMQQSQQKQHQHILFGKEIVITGGKTPEIMAKIKDIGAIIGSSVTNKTTLLIAQSHDDMTTKAQSARAKNVQIVTADEFLDI